MIRRYRRARCLVTPASTVILEAFTAGCPMISGWVAENQRNSLDWFARRGVIVNAGARRQMSVKALTLAHASEHRQSGQMIRKQRAYIKDLTESIDEIVKAILAVA